MNKIWLLATVMMCTMVLSSCEEDYVVRFINSTQHELTLVFGYLDERNDTTIIIDDKTGGLSEAMELYGNLPPHGMNNKVFISYHDEEGTTRCIRKKYHGLMRIFIVKTEDVEKYGWKKVAEENMVIQRYDIARFLDFPDNTEDIYFPPTPGMMKYDMWPPYGTYSIHLP